MKRGMLLLLIALPLASVLMGALAFYLAFSAPDPAIEPVKPVLDKTSWQSVTPDEARAR